MSVCLGYARVSTKDQSVDMQLKALQPICGDRIWQESKSGTSVIGRKELALVIEEAKRLRSTGEEVTLVVYSLSRLGRRVVDLVAMVEELQRLQIGFRSISESIDTSTAMGRCFFNIVAALAQAEAEVLGERTRAGLKAAVARGKRLGRPSATHDVIQQAKSLIEAGASVRSASKSVGISHTTLLRQLRTAVA
jgi:DNA invertase Pin-like site-specific DNA recombinase